MTAGRAAPARRPRRQRSGWRPEAGARLRAELTHDRDGAGIRALIEQAARCADRLEGLDRLHRGDADQWLRLEVVRLVAEQTPARERKAFYVDVGLRIDNTIAEERQQAKLLASLLTDIYRQRAALPPAPPENGGGADDLDLDD